MENHSNTNEISRVEYGEEQDGNKSLMNQSSIIELLAHSQCVSQLTSMSHIEEVLLTHMGITDLEEIFFKDMNGLSFLSVFNVISLLGVGAFGVVLEV